MGEFSAEWLALREPADHQARSLSLTREVLSALSAAPGILDMACGTGSNFRYLSRQPALSHASWLLVDHDATLLGLIGPEANVVTRRHDLQSLDEGLFQGRSFVTASALLDLVSEPWVRLLASRCRHQRSAVLLALSYDGRMTCAPEEPDDALVRELVNRHQKTDKGFGPALGPDAAARAADVFAHAGYQVATCASDWVLKPGLSPPALQRQLIDGWSAAAVAIAPERKDQIEAWRVRRRTHVDAGRSVLTVGHQDLAGVLA
jgi:hypothetical protein